MLARVGGSGALRTLNARSSGWKRRAAWSARAFSVSARAFSVSARAFSVSVRAFGVSVRAFSVSVRAFGVSVRAARGPAAPAPRRARRLIDLHLEVLQRHGGVWCAALEPEPSAEHVPQVAQRVVLALLHGGLEVGQGLPRGACQQQHIRMQQDRPAQRCRGDVETQPATHSVSPKWNVQSQSHALASVCYLGLVLRECYPFVVQRLVLPFCSPASRRGCRSSAAAPAPLSPARRPEQRERVRLASASP